MVSDPSRLWELATQCINDSRRWFPDTQESIVHHCLGLAGETGEFIEIVKKIDRGTLDPNSAVVRRELAMELTDVFIYVLNLAGLLGVDLEKAYDMKRQLNEKRFGHGPERARV